MNDLARTAAEAAREIRDRLGATPGSTLEDRAFADVAAQMLVNAAFAARIAAESGTAARDAAHGGGSDDPLLHFYERFLAAYDPALRGSRGVYFTPAPVVRYVVRSVIELLDDAFGFVADAPSGAFTVLDPACGTGAFLNELVVAVRARFIERGDPAGWHAHVRTALLPRLLGCEVLPVPYAIARMKLALTLRGDDLPEPHRTRFRYDLGQHDRLRIVLGNALDPNELDASARGANALNVNPPDTNTVHAVADRGAGAGGGIAVVVGNPPYSGHSANGRAARAYRADAAEANTKWLHDDYVKFIRLAEERVERAGCGIVAFVTNHAYLDNPTFGGMRRQLMRTFDEMFVLDLHGNAKIVETAPDGSRDENVFDIRQGVAIGIFVKHRRERTGGCAVKFAELYGDRRSKYEWLSAATVRSTPWTAIVPARGIAMFRPARDGAPLGYAMAPSLASAMPVSSLGVLTKRDALAVAFTPHELLERLASFADPRRTVEQTASAFGLAPCDHDGWDLADARRVAANADPAHVRRMQYRCGDVRCYYDARGIVARRNRRVLDHVAGAERFAFLVGRQGGSATSGPWDSLWVTAISSDQNLFRRGGATVFPVMLNGADAGAAQPRWNFSDAFVDYAAARARESDRAVVQRLAAGYIYGLLSAPRFRAEFAGELRREFPRIPVVDAGSFAALSAIGWRLVRLHLAAEAEPVVTFPVAGADIVDRGRFTLAETDAAGFGVVVVNEAGQRFERVHRHAWQRTCGGSPVLESYLRARKGRKLSGEEICAFARLATAFDRERGLLAEADEVLSALLDGPGVFKE